MLDGFDEISPFYKETVIDLLQALRQTAVEQLWVTTRPHLREELEDEVQQLSYSLEPFSEENQLEFLLKFWCLKDWFSGVGSGTEEEVKIKLVYYAKHLIKKLAQSIGDEEKEFTGIPLQCHMLAEAFDKEVQAFCQSTEFVPELPYKLDLIGLFEKFIERKYEICLQEKGKISTTNLFANEAQKELIKKFIENYRILALKMLFAEEQLDLLHIDSQCTSLDETLTRTGIVQISNEGKLHFIHHTFAEFYVADYFVKELKKGSNIFQQLQDLLLQKIFVENEYRVIRVFIDGLLSRSKPQYEVLKQYGNHIHDLGNGGVLTLHTAAYESNANIIGFLLDSVQVAGHTDTLVKLLLAQDVKQQTAWHLAANHGQLEALEKLWKCAKEVLNTDGINYKLLLVKDYVKETVLHHASFSGNMQILEGIWKLAKEQLTPEKLNKFLIAQNNRKRTAWHMAVSWGKVEILDKLWELAKEVLNRDELNNDLLLAKDEFEETALHHALYIGNVQILERIWKLAKEQLSQEELNKLLLAQNNQNRTAWHVAAERGKVEIIDKLWEWAKEVLNRDELNNLLLAKDYGKEIVLHHASFSGNVQVLERIWKLAKDQLTPEGLNKFLLAQNNRK
jgi:ankyrin repeat protein